jgi:hypothetical protein
LAVKNKIDGYTGDASRLFGSWGELAVASGDNNKMASGAAWGYASNNNGALQPNSRDGLSTEGNPGGGMSDDECDYSVLTFGSGCGMFSDKGGGSDNIDIDKLIGELKEAGYEKKGSIEEVKTFEENGNKKRYYYAEKVDIGSNIEIDRAEERYGKFGNVKSIVIMAKNIDISCGVTRIDAILIATEVIDTCVYDEKPNSSNGGDDWREKAEGQLANLGIAQQQLIINGAMYAKTIYFDRTYGAGTGTRSIVPAEIVNYDNSMLFTGGSGGGTANGDGVMDVVYVRELAPRY